MYSLARRKDRNNAFGAGNQQERQAYYVGWIIGFTDGEGCFSVSIVKNARCKTGWQVYPEFVITQGKKSLLTLQRMKKFFGCGKIYVNTRYDNHRESLYRYCVRRANDLRENIIPFFKKYPLQTAKQNDFERFVKILEMMKRNAQYSARGIDAIARIVEGMNRKKRSQYLESSETIRQTKMPAIGLAH